MMLVVESPGSVIPRIMWLCQCMLQECLGIRLFEHVGVPNKMKQPNEHFLSYCSTFLEMSVFCFWALFNVSKEGSGTVDERSTTFGNGNAWASDHPCRSVSDRWGVEESGAASALETSWSSLVLQYSTKAAHLDHGPSSWTLLDICVWNFEADSFRNGSGRFLIHLTRPKGEPCQSRRRRKEQQGFFAAMTSTWRARYRCLASATSWPGENVTFNVGQEMARASIHLPKRPHAHNKNAECHQRNLLRPINHDCDPTASDCRKAQVGRCSKALKALPLVVRLDHTACRSSAGLLQVGEELLLCYLNLSSWAEFVRSTVE